jgi:hypothetical protein
MIQVGTAPPRVMDYRLRPRRSIRSFAPRAVFLSIVTPFRLLTGALALAAALPAAAEAATWTHAPGRCYVSAGADPIQREVIQVGAEGFAPGAPVDVLLDGVPADADGDGIADSVSADPAGRVEGSLRAPHQAAGERPVTIVLSQRDDPANRVTAVSRVTALSLTLTPAEAAPSKRVRFRGRGFMAQRSVWAHYVFKGKSRRTVRLAQRPRGSCGTFSVRRRQIPITRPSIGRWTLQVDQQRTYSPLPQSVSVRMFIDVQRVVRAG